MTWQQRAETLKKTLSWTETAKKVRLEFFPNDDLQTVYSRVRAHVRRAGATEKVESNQFDLISLLEKHPTITDIAQKSGSSERVALAMIEDLAEKGYCVAQIDGKYFLSRIPNAEPETIDNNWNGDKIIRFGILGDTQINSKYTQITHTHTAYDIFKAEGIRVVYHTGDLDEGEKMRPGHEYEIYNHGSDAHVAEIIKVYPKRDGIITRFILGNHDAAYIKLAGIDIGVPVSAARSDMEYLGQSQAFVQLTPGCTLELRHPGDGTAYAQSYKIQKMIESMSGGEKPSILAVGHYHKQETMLYRNVHSIQTACLQAQTPWMRGKGISAALGFYIIEIHVDDDGQINRFIPEFFPFYKAIKDDYMNWR